MKNKTTRNSLLLVLTALIWGIAFVAQSEGGNAIGPYSFNCIRFLIGGFVLIPVIKLLDRLGYNGKKSATPESQKTLLKGGVICGIILCIASNLQQAGIYMGCPAGKAGFLTACYIILVPILGLFLKKKCSIRVWIGIILTVIGLYLLCLNETLTLQPQDILVLICALCFAFHILAVDYFTPLVEGIRMSCIQFWVAGCITAVPMLLFEMKPFSGNLFIWGSAFQTSDAWIPLLYAGILSCGVAYTLQIIGQEDVNPAVASLLMSLESVFSVLAGFLLLHQKLSVRELSGCAFIFAAVILAQLPVKEKSHPKKENDKGKIK